MLSNLGEVVSISIHAPREGGDFSVVLVLDTYHVFQSTPPARGATHKFIYIIAQLPISIHAPREGGDVSASFVLVPTIDFNPRPPRGGRHLPPINVYW